MYFGCNCQNEFRNLGGSCYKIPCKIVDYLLEDFGGFLRDLQNEVDSMEDFMELITERIFEPMMEMTCECSSGLVDAMFGCQRCAPPPNAAEFLGHASAQNNSSAA